MKLTWHDIITTLFAIMGGTVVYAVFYNFDWAIIDSFRSAVAVLAVIGLGMFAFSGFNFSNFSILNVAEMILGIGAIGLAIGGMIVASEAVFYVLAATLGVLWLSDTARHARHSILHDTTSDYQRPVHLH